MRKSQPYTDWKKELQIWQATNTTLDVDRKIQAGTLFESLEGTPRQTVLSEMTVDQITDDDGVQNIIRTLDRFFLGNETQNAYSAIDALLQFKCEKGETMENFIVQFQLKVNKVKSSGTILSDGVLGYTLLNSANLPQDKHDMVKATCDDLNYKNVKTQLEKIGFTKLASKSSTIAGVSNVKFESCLYGDMNQSNYHQRSGESSESEEDLNGEKVFYSENKAFNDNGSRGNSKYKLNPTDRFGHIRSCTYCKCLYHWLIDCPYAPVSVKHNLRVKGTQVKPNKTL